MEIEPDVESWFHHTSNCTIKGSQI